MSTGCICMQARVAAAEMAMLGQQSASDSTDETAEADMTPTEELELDVTGVLDDDAKQDTLGLTLDRESAATAFLPSHDVTSENDLSGKVDADDLLAEVHTQHRASIKVHHKGATPGRGDEDSAGECTSG